MNKKEYEIQQRQISYLNQDKKNNNSILYYEDYKNFAKRFQPESIDLLITDPPYLTEFTETTFKSFVEDWTTTILPLLNKQARAYIFMGAYPFELYTYIQTLRNTDWIIDNPLIWRYDNTLGNTPKMKYNLNYQVCLHLYRDTSRPLNTQITNEMFNCGEAELQSIMKHNAPDGRLGDRYHSWQKPMELAQRLVNHSGLKNGIMIDPFTCTSTFNIAASKYGMKSYGCDISEDNLKIAEKRGSNIERF